MHRLPPPLAGGALAAVLAAVLGGCGGGPGSDPGAADRASSSPTSSSPTPSSPSSPAASRSASATVRPSTAPSRTAVAPRPRRTSTAVGKVLVFVVENHSLTQMREGMPYAYGLARRYGYATHFTAITHPSLPNYVAITGGSTHGITDDEPPSAHPVHGPSVFGQAIAHGRTAAVYADGMPGTCALGNGGTRYAVKHNPWAYFVDERAACGRFDVPLTRLDAAIGAGRLPAVGMVVPDLCHDAHDCSMSVADTWFRGVMERVLAGPDWRAGRLAVVLTGDEDDRSEGNTVLTVVVHPSQRHHVVTTPLNHYSLSGLLSEVAGAGPLGRAAGAPSLARAFGLTVGG